jgi:hypothetical protein
MLRAIYKNNMKPKAKCSFEGCTKSVLAWELCAAHYKQRLRGGPLKPLRYSGPNKVLLGTIAVTPSCADRLAGEGPSANRTTSARLILEAWAAEKNK